jgi:phosphatidylethanolamine-binding protein (PEBP) family uncharacterized protein
VVPLTLAAGATLELPVGFSPAATGRYDGAIAIRSNDAAAPNQSVTLLGHGIRAGETGSDNHGNNSWGKAEWGGPAPPSGTHHYVFKLYALKEPVVLKPGADAKALEASIKGKILAEAKLVGLFPAAR